MSEPAACSNCYYYRHRQHWERVRRSRWDQPASGYLPDQSNAYWSTLNPIFLLNYVIIASLMLHGWSCADSRSQASNSPSARSSSAVLIPPKGNLLLSLFFLWKKNFPHRKRHIFVLVLSQMYLHPLQSSEHQLPNRSLQSQLVLLYKNAHARTMTQVIIELIMLTRRWSKPPSVPILLLYWYANSHFIHWAIEEQ